MTKLRARDGGAVGTYAVGAKPFGLAFDGTHLWVANGSGNSVTKLRVSDGGAVGTYAVGSGPAAIAFDGTHIWVANFDGGSVTKLQPSDGSLVGDLFRRHQSFRHRLRRDPHLDSEREQQYGLQALAGARRCGRPTLRSATGFEGVEGWDPSTPSALTSASPFRNRPPLRRPSIRVATSSRDLTSSRYSASVVCGRVARFGPRRSGEM